MFYDLQQTVPNKAGTPLSLSAVSMTCCQVQAAGTRLLVDPKSRPADSAPAAPAAYGLWLAHPESLTDGLQGRSDSAGWQSGPT